MRAPAAVDSGVSAHSGCGLPKVQIRVLLLVLLTTPLLELLLEPAAPAAPAVEVQRSIHTEKMMTKLSDVGLHILDGLIYPAYLRVPCARVARQPIL